VLKNPKMKGRKEDPGISETESSDEEWGTITAFKYKKALAKLAVATGMDSTEGYLGCCTRPPSRNEG
jgi:hypothetical protein